MLSSIKPLHAAGLVVVALIAVGISVASCSSQALPNDDPAASAANTTKFRNMTPGGGAPASAPSSSAAPAPSSGQ